MPHPNDAKRRFRCAIYTRKSSDEGLEQSFNSLDAQRDACEAYVASQKHEGWLALADQYDDGGFSGGSMQRPALQRLLDDVAKGRLDIVVVYKVDRLTRSLSDFAKLTDLLDKHGASFVSVTQQFNTSTSMGRLTLNVLLSFAQFEREVAGERIRDKIALSKRRGMWMGGLPPLGYDGIDRALVINEQEAETVRLIFDRYLEVGSVAELKRSLDNEGIVSKRRRFRDGTSLGGVSFSRGALYQILRNRLYRGEIAHRGEIHQGNHNAIIDDDLWDRVQNQLVDQSQRKRAEAAESTDPSGVASKGMAPSPAPSPLTGLLFDEAGRRLTPSHARKNGKRYRYYVSAPLSRGEKIKDGVRVPAPDLEQLVLATIVDHLRDSIWLTGLLGEAIDARDVKALLASGGAAAHSFARDGQQDRSLKSCCGFIRRIIVRQSDITLSLDRQRLLQRINSSMNESLPTKASSDAEDKTIEIVVSARFIRSGKQVRLVLGEVSTKDRLPDPNLIRLITDARRWFEDLCSGRATTIAEVALRDRVAVAHVSRTLPLAFLAPDIVDTILSGRHPPSLTPDRLKRRQSLPALWCEQRAALID
jgi:DNA invertase Pin-like site-specific DNA recombinase